MFESTVSSISDPLAAYWRQFVDYLPQLVGAIVVLIIGLVVASVLGAVVRKLLELAESNRHVTNFLKRWNISIRLSTFVSKFTWWVVFLVFLSAAVQILKIQVLTDTLNSLVAYLPSIFAASIVAVAALVGAKVVRGLIREALVGLNFAQARLVSNSVYVVLVVFGLTLALAQLGLDMTLITANLTVIVAGIVLALALAFGLGGREVAGKIVSNLYEGNKPTSKKSRK